MKKFLLTILLLSLPVNVQAARLLNEADYRDAFCKQYNGITEYKLTDLTRVDCLTPDYAVEVDFAKKWAEAVGQSLHYGIMTGKKPGIVLIIENLKDYAFFNRLKQLCERYGIRLWYVEAPN